MGIYGSPRIFCDLREVGLACGENRVARLMKAAQIKSVRGYKRPRFKVGKPALVPPNQLHRQFKQNEPDQAWVADITYIHTHEGWLYLAAVPDLQSRALGWSMGSHMQTSLVLDALTMAVWRRRPKDSVIIHLDLPSLAATSTLRISTIGSGATSISINSALMSSSGVKLCSKNCLEVWWNARHSR